MSPPKTSTSAIHIQMFVGCSQMQMLSSTVNTFLVVEIRGNMCCLKFRMMKQMDTWPSTDSPAQMSRSNPIALWARQKFMEFVSSPLASSMPPEHSTPIMFTAKSMWFIDGLYVTLLKAWLSEKSASATTETPKSTNPIHIQLGSQRVFVFLVILQKQLNMRVPTVIIRAITIFSLPSRYRELLPILEKKTPTMTAVKQPSLSPTTRIGYGMQYRQQLSALTLTKYSTPSTNTSFVGSGLFGSPLILSAAAAQRRQKTLDSNWTRSECSKQCFQV